MACAARRADTRSVTQSMKRLRSSGIGWCGKGACALNQENSNMENTSGNSDTSGGLESANSGSAADDLDGIRSADPLALAQTCIERAIDQLTYGRRQEAESALLL